MLNKGKIHKGNIAILNAFAPKTRAPKFINETLLQTKSNIDPCETSVYSTLSSRQIIQTKNKVEMLKLRKLISQMDLLDTQRTF